jgi:hypothetical protein
MGFGVSNGFKVALLGIVRFGKLNGQISNIVLNKKKSGRGKRQE